MKNPQRLKQTVLISALALASCPSVHATELFNVPPSPVYQVVKNQPLTEALSDVAARSGIVFKVNISLSNNVVSKTLAVQDWDEAVKVLLDGYNYSVIQEDGVKNVIISGYNGSRPATAVASDKLLLIKAKPNSLPTKYSHYPVGSVLPVTLPMDTILGMKAGETAKVDLPIGLIETTHDETVADAFGNKTWVGHLSEEGTGYRMMLSQGPSGIMGHIVTPEGTFTIEGEGSETYMVDTRQLLSGADAEDGVTPVTTLMNGLIQNATAVATPSIAQLQAAVDAAKKADDAAQLAANTAAQLSATAVTKYNAAVAAVNLAINNLNEANAVYAKANTAYNQAPTAANKTTLAAALTALNTKKTAYTTAVNAAQSAATAKTTASTNAKAKAEAALKTKATYDAAVSALKAAQTTPTTSTPTPVPSAASNKVVDLMVLYTTTNTTADFAKQRIQYLVTASNTAYKDSGVNMTLRLVYAEPTTYSATANNSQTLRDLANDVGVFKGTKAKRLQYGADLVAVFRPFYKSHVSCGTAYVGFSGGSGVNSSTGFGSISDGVAKDNTGASSYYCDINTFTHEIGHNLGLVHDREYSSGQGAFSYSYAWGIQGKFGTIMSYKSPAVMLFSSSLLTKQCAGTPCGFAETNAAQSSDQVKSVNLTVERIANYLPTLTTTPVIK